MWELDYKESWVPKNWCFWTVVLEKTLESSLDRKEIQKVHPKGDQSWVSIGRTDVETETPILWPPDSKSWLIWKYPDAGNAWWWKEKATTEEEMVRWHYQLNEHESVNPSNYLIFCCPLLLLPLIFPASGSFPMKWLFTSGGQRIGVSASSVLPMHSQNLCPLGWTGLISLQSKGLSRFFSNTTVQKLQFFSAQLSL